jgi:hypothetical protein
MKKVTTVFIAIILMSYISSAQTAAKPEAQFTTAMEVNLKMMDTATTAATYTMLANSFERIGTAAKTYWQPFYYAALCYTLMAADEMQDVANIDPLTAKAENYLTKAGEISKDNSEISALHAMIINIQIMVDPMGRFQNNSMQSGALLEKARQQNPLNPRPYLIQARTILKTPEAFGGGEAVAKPLLEKALAKFKEFKPDNLMAPNWGQAVAQKIYDNLGK